MARAKRESKNPRTKLPPETKPSSETKSPLDWGPIKPPPGWHPIPSSGSSEHFWEVDDLPTPSLTVAWTEENVPELAAMLLRGLRDLKVDKQKGLYPKASDAGKYFKERPRSDGKPVSDKIADVFASACRPLKGMEGGDYKGGTKKD